MLPPPSKPPPIPGDLERALAEAEQLMDRLQTENGYLREELRGAASVDEIVGRGPELQRVLAAVDELGPTETPVTIVGEPGTGKELIAHALHERSARRGRLLVKVDCAAIPAGLFESELLGHAAGAFPGALEARAGRVELAGGGSLFLDEVAELPPAGQAVLARVLGDRVDVRVLAATHRELADEVAAGRFQADLFQLLGGVALRLPPLRARREDIAPLALYFVQRFARKLGRPMPSVSRELLERLAGYPWPGNVRELRHVIQRAVLSSPGPALVIPPEVLVVRTVVYPAPDEPPLTELQRDYIAGVLASVGWVIEGPNGAAASLRLHPNTLRSRLKKLGLRRPARISAAAR